MTRILIYGAGVIGSLYGAMLADAGFDVTLYARGKRLESLQTNGLRYVGNKQIKTAPVTVISKLERTDRYDFIFLTVRENQLLAALSELKENISPTIVTMVNSLDTYDKWEALSGKDERVQVLSHAIDGGCSRLRVQQQLWRSVYVPAFHESAE